MIDIKKLLFLLSLLVHLAALGQERIDKPEDVASWKLKNHSKAYLKVFDFYAAYPLVEELYNRKPEDKAVVRMFATCNRETRNYKEALKLYEFLYKLDPYDDPEATFYYGLMLKRIGKYDQALEYFAQFKKSYDKQDPSLSAYFNVLDAEMAGCKLAENLGVSDSVRIVHLDTNINKPHIDCAPFPYGDSLLFYASLKTDKFFFPDNIIPKRQFYLARKLDTLWVDTLQFFPFNDTTIDISNGFFTKNKLEFYFSKCKKVETTNLCHIYKSSFNGNVWSKPRKLDDPINLDEYTSSYPSIGKDDKGKELLYFISNRPGGMGGLDIWCAELDGKDGFKKAINCGKLINSKQNEISPWFDAATNSLYFSSDGQAGYGGYDIFHTYGQKRNWTKPINIGGPFNSSADDLHYIQNEFDQKSGFIVSNREGSVPLDNTTCCDDIFEFSAKTTLELILEGDFFTDDTLLVDGDNNTYVNLFLNTKPKPTLVARKKFDKNSSKYTFEVKPGADYKILVEKTGFFDATKEFSTKEVNNLDTIRISRLNLLAKERPIIIKNIYYPFDKDYLTDSSKIVIDTTIFKIMEDNIDIIVEIGSHTDSKGSDIYNEDLSQRRAQSVVDYLILKGLDAKRLQAKGYGEYRPIAPNEYPDGSDNPDGRQRNRRTEFKVVGILQGVSDIIYEE